MSRFAKHGRRLTGKRAFSCRFGQTRAAAGALALAVQLALSLAPAASAQSGSGIYINNNVLDNLGPGPAAAPGALLAPAAPSAQPLAPLAPQPQGGNGTLTFQTYGSGNYVVTRPGTLLFPPLEAPTSTLAPGFTDNQAARTEAMNNAFAAGPEPSSQLLISPGSGEADSDSVAIYMDNLPPADPGVAQGTAPVLTLRRPPLPAPAPAPRKPEVPAEMLAETGATAIDETTATLAPEFQAPEPAAPAAPPEMADVPEVAEVEEAPLAAVAPAESQAATAPAPAELAQIAPDPAEPGPAKAETAELAEMEPASAAPAQSEAARVEPEPAAPTISEPPVATAEAPAEAMVEPAPATESVEAQREPAPARGADIAAATASDPAGAPVSLLPADSGGAMTDSPEPTSPEPTSLEATGPEPASREAANPVASADVPAPTMQTASLPPSAASDTAATPGASTADRTDSGAVADMSLVFATDSAELSAVVQNELRSLAHVMRARDDGRIQVLGFASAESGSQDLARKLALSRALKVRTFLIDAGVPSTRIQVRSLGAQSDGGPANRVDIRPIDS